MPEYQNNTDQMKGTEFPFKYLESSESSHDNLEKKLLALIGLNAESTADEVRETAKSLREKAKSSIRLDQIYALKIALGKTGNVTDDFELNAFLLGGLEFDEILKRRNLILSTF